MSKTLEWWRNATPEQKAERRAQMAAEREAQNAKRAAEQKAWRETYYATANLQRSAESTEPYGPGGAPHPRQAKQLLRLDTIEERMRATSEAGTRQNLMGGILSDNLYYTVNDMLAAKAAGRADEELYGERTARQYREAENARRAAELQAVARTYGAGRS